MLLFFENYNSNPFKAVFFELTLNVFGKKTAKLEQFCHYQSFQKWKSVIATA